MLKLARKFHDDYIEYSEANTLSQRLGELNSSSQLRMLYEVSVNHPLHIEGDFVLDSLVKEKRIK